jgi:hypothetical protein
VREVETMIRLREGGIEVILPVIAHDQTEDHPYFVMPWYEAGSLEEAIRRRNTALRRRRRWALLG